MHFAYFFPWWAAVLVLAAVAALAYLSYRRPLLPLSLGQRATLGSLRGLALLIVALCLFRPVLLLPPHGTRDAVVPILIDASRSMRLADGGSRSRLERALNLVRTDLEPRLGRDFRIELFSFGDHLQPVQPDQVRADERASDLARGLRTIESRLRGDRVAGVIVLSDGGFTGDEPQRALGRRPVPVYPIGLGSTGAWRDREVLGITAGEAHLQGSTVDLAVSAVSRGFGREPFDLRILANGRPVATRRITPDADGAPVHEVFSVSPDARTPTVYTAEIPAVPGEAAAENNTRGVLVAPAGRKRKILLVEGAPGFDHSFLSRALGLDAGLDVDMVVRKGENANGQGTFLIQANDGRAQALRTGFPQTAEALDGYDALILGNISADELSHAQLDMAADFVGRRGGGLLLFGGLSFAHHGFATTPLATVLPLSLDDERGGVTLTSLAGAPGERMESNKVVPTLDGLSSPVTRLGTSSDDTRKKWAALPALASATPLGAPRPGATVLAVTAEPGGAIVPVVAVQRYGQGRSMLFTGEASWRWKMMMPSSDLTYDTFWREVARWLSVASPDPVMVSAPADLEPGDAAPIDVTVKNATFDPVSNAVVRVTVTGPGGQHWDLRENLDEPADGRYRASLRLDRAGLYHVSAQADRGNQSLGRADGWLLVGGADRELTDPRVHEDGLRRLAAASGGRYLDAGAIGQLPRLLADREPLSEVREERDLWDSPWVIAAVLLLLSAEWLLRRRWGLR
jgi:uncharacterized membrane protein